MMFTKLFDFTFQRTTIQALGWYIAWLVMIAVGAGLTAGILVGTAAALGLIPVDSDMAYALGYQIGLLIGVASCIALCRKLLQAKQLGHNTKWIILSLIAVVLTYFTGGLGGLIIPAIMTTLPRSGEIIE